MMGIPVRTELSYPRMRASVLALVLVYAYHVGHVEQQEPEPRQAVTA